MISRSRALRTNNCNFSYIHTTSYCSGTLRSDSTDRDVSICSCCTLNGDIALVYDIRLCGYLGRRRREDTADIHFGICLCLLGYNNIALVDHIRVGAIYTVCIDSAKDDTIIRECRNGNCASVDNIIVNMCVGI